jgi:hypothetical protein
VQLKDFFKIKPSIPVRIIRGGVVASVLWGAFYSYIQQLPDQKFTEQETEHLTRVFQNSVDTSVINYHRSTQWDVILKLHDYAGLTLGNTFILNTELKSESAYYQDTFIHEAAHIWQKQNCSSFFSGFFEWAGHVFDEPTKIYEYELDTAKDLLDYNSEQQASIIADYFSSKRKYSSSTLLQNKGPDEEINTLYLSVLDKFLQDPSYIKQQCSFSISI